VWLVGQEKVGRFGATALEIRLVKKKG